ncbi:MAG: hypothetical protein COC22_00220 [Flavobacteriaceae bacterium]|nr:MAG: hypothetical protein COC22_00220 [Flavobacteriaceae bacterium]
MLTKQTRNESKVIYLPPLIRSNIKPLLPFLERPNLIEFSINKPGEVFLLNYEGWTRHDAPDLDIDTLQFIGQTLATSSGQLFNNENPILSCDMPGYGYRVEALMGAVADSGFCMSIRVGAAKRFPIDTYFNQGDCIEVVKAIAVKKNILIVGGTETGKTTFFNSLLRHFPKESRYVVIEDVKELVVEQKNTVRLKVSRNGNGLTNTTYGQIVESCKRLKPERFLMGELGTANTVPFIDLLNTGHSGSISTIHASATPSEAINAIRENAARDGEKYPEIIAQNAIERIHYFVFLSRDESGKTRKYKAALVKNDPSFYKKKDVEASDQIAVQIESLIRCLEKNVEVL